MNDPISRRRFLKQGTAASLGLTLASRLSAADPTPSANERLSVAVIGTNSRGLWLAECLTGIKETEISYVCDVDDRAIKKGLDTTAKGQKNVPKTSKDFRQILADPSVDAVAIATPDHWHAPLSILALAAGKHVYVEKPCSHNPYEGELFVQAAAKYGKVAQMGNQRRSFPNMIEAIKLIREGIIGHAYFGRAWYANDRKSIGHGKPASVPGWLDYELWQGPAPRHEYVDNLIHYNWHWFWRYGTGEALNNGTHEVDVCRWALGVDFPERVSSNGGRYAFQDDWETPDTQTIGWDFPGGKTISWEGRSCNNFTSEKLGRGAMVFGTGGTALLDGDNCTFYDAQNKVVRQLKSGGGGTDASNTLSSTGIELDRLHVSNFVDAARGNGQPNSPITEGHKSVAMLHLGNIAWRVGHSLHCNPADGHIQNDPDAMKLWRRDYEPGWEPKV